MKVGTKIIYSQFVLVAGKDKGCHIDPHYIGIDLHYIDGDGKIRLVFPSDYEETRFVIKRKGEKHFLGFIDDELVGTTHSINAILQRFRNLIQNDVIFDKSDFKEVEE